MTLCCAGGRTHHGWYPESSEDFTVICLFWLRSADSAQVCRGSHRLRAFDRLRDYSASRVGADGTRSGWLSDDGAAHTGRVRIIG